MYTNDEYKFVPFLVMCTCTAGSLMSPVSSDEEEELVELVELDSDESVDSELLLFGFFFKIKLMNTFILICSSTFVYLLVTIFIHYFECSSTFVYSSI